MSASKKATVPIDDNLGEMLNWAVRYALGRRTYAVSDTCRYITPIIPQLNDRTLLVIYQDIHEQEKRGGDYGDECDKADWMRLEKAVSDELERRGYVKLGGAPWHTKRPH